MYRFAIRKKREEVCWRFACTPLHFSLRSNTARKGLFLFPTGLVVETSKKLSKRLEQTLPSHFLPCVMALLLQSFLNLLVMDNFQPTIRKRLHMSLPSFLSIGMFQVVGVHLSASWLIHEA